MISNLSNYNAWKRSTLNRVSVKFASHMVRMLGDHTRRLEPSFNSAIESRSLFIAIPLGFLKTDLEKIFLHHLHDTIYVAVSDGMREMGPEKKLSTWERYPYDYPVELTFTNLAEKKLRDTIAAKTFRSIRKRNLKLVSDIVESELDRYKKNVQAVFQNIAEAFYKRDDNETPRSAFVDLIGRVFQKTESQAETVFRTETTRYFNDARVAYFQENTDVDFVQIVAVTDGRISNICEARDGYVIPIARANENQFKPPFHFSCRSIQSPLDTDLESDRAIVRSSLGVEFGKVHSQTSDLDFTGRRAKPSVPLPRGWT